MKYKCECGNYSEIKFYSFKNGSRCMKCCNNKEYRYYPDIYIKSENKIIEIKSDYTYNAMLIKNIIKSLSARKAGFNYEIWIYDRIRNKIII